MSNFIEYLRPGESVQWTVNPVGICDVCGCLHRSGGHVCNSCFSSMSQVAMGRVVVAANILAQAFRDAGNALGDCKWYGPSPLVMLHPTEPDAQRFAVIGPHWANNDALIYKSARIDPVVHVGDCLSFDAFSTGLMERVAAARGLPGSTALSRRNAFSDILQHCSLVPAEPAEPVMKRNKRNRGPQQHGKWWNGPRKF